MSCGMSHERLWAWVHDEEEDDAARANIAEHVATCDSCRAQVAEMRDIVGDLQLAVRDAAPTPLPDWIGDYRIIRKLGQGGMGVVFEAEQPEPRRRVALKVVLGERYVDEFHAKLFQREAQALAHLNHPGIAAIYEAGSADDGSRFFAMELVRGVSLTEYVNRPDGPLPLRDRLRLFVTVCEAINYAHQRGVIHRDLKPSNILVDRAGNPKVLDFGLARITEADLNVVTVATETGRMLGTLPYMSPEQARADTDNIDVRADVYALGVVLYELATGVLPLDVSQLPLHEAVRDVCERRPPRPRSINRALPADVETIALKALEKDPARRYQGVEALADDVRRYLDSRPILARPPSAAYQLRKFVTRHKLPSALAAWLLTALVAFAVTTHFQSQRVAAERDRAERETRTVAQINAVLENLWESADPWQAGDRDLRVIDALDGAAKRVEAELVDAPLVAAAVRSAIANTYVSFSDYEKAERHLRFALEKRLAELGPHHPRVAESRNALAELLLVRGRGEDVDEAGRLFQQALTTRRKTLSPAHPDTAASLNNLGFWLKARGDHVQAEARYREALQMREALLAALQRAPARTHKQLVEAHDALAQTKNNLAALFRATKRLDQAQRYYREALDERRRWLGDDHPQVAKLFNNLGKFFQDRGNYAEAERHLRESLRMLRAGLGDEHHFIARALDSLAEVLFLRAQFDEAESTCRQALAMRRKLLGDDHPRVAESRELLQRIRAQAETATPRP